MKNFDSMKQSVGLYLTVRLAAFLQCFFMYFSCGLPEDKENGTGQLRVSFENAVGQHTRVIEAIPDTSDFLLRIEDSSGKIVYHGKFGACPETLEVPSGSYSIRTFTSEFSKPAFSSPQYGDEQCVIVPSGGVADVKLICRLLNSGVRLDIDEGFLTGCPDGILFLKSLQGKLMYSYSEERIAYFLPGSVSLVLSSSGKEQTLLTRNLEAQQILHIKVSVASGYGSSVSQGFGGLSVVVDTTRHWIDDEVVIGGSSGGGIAVDDALTVARAIAGGPREDVWVSGYIVGGDLTSKSANFSEPFKSSSNLLLGPRSTTSDRDACIAVQLPAGRIREDLNLVDNPQRLGEKICLRGDVVESYFNLTGLKNIEDYK